MRARRTCAVPSPGARKIPRPPATTRRTVTACSTSSPPRRSSHRAHSDCPTRRRRDGVRTDNVRKTDSRQQIADSRNFSRGCYLLSVVCCLLPLRYDLRRNTPRTETIAMRIGVPTEIKDNEYRVGMTPSGVRDLSSDGHSVYVQNAAGDGSGFADDEYVAAGAQILPDADAVYSEAEMIVKVKEPIDPDLKRMKDGQLLFTYL